VSTWLKLVFSCPVCRGPIAWAVQPAFTCHHCQLALSSNMRAARAKAVAAAVVAEVVLLLALLFWLPQPSTGFVVWLSVVGVLGLAAGWVALKVLVSLQLMHPQAPASPNPSIERTSKRLRLFAAAHVER
jgi:hypothetical protein